MRHAGNIPRVTDLMSRDGLDSVRRRAREDPAERFRWPLIGLGAAGIGVANYVGLIFAGVPTFESLIIAAGLTVMIVFFYVVLGVATGRRVTPVEPRRREAVNELEPLVRFENAAEAAQGAGRRNESAEPGEFWKPEPRADGTWGLRHRRTLWAGRRPRR